MTKEGTNLLKIAVQVLSTIVLSIGSWFLFQIWDTTAETNERVHQMDINDAEQNQRILYVEKGLEEVKDKGELREKQFIQYFNQLKR